MKLLFIFLGINFGIFAQFSLNDVLNSLVAPFQIIHDVPPVCDLITKHGYPCNIYEVLTSNGYILTMHRISNGTKNNITSKEEVVLLIHALYFSAADWLFQGPNTGLPFLLADAGYDVWMGNIRGTDQSQKHVKDLPGLPYSTFPEYWDFDWHDAGVYDLPAMINYTLCKTGKSNLTVVGHSQGCTLTLIAGTFYPYLANQIKCFFALAPAVNLTNTKKELFIYMAKFEPPLRAATLLTGYYKFSPSDGILKDAASAFCTSISPDLCPLFLTAVGFGSNSTNQTIINTAARYTPSAYSIKQLLHYLQIINSSCFRQYDYGFFKNIEEYGSPEPPIYDISQIRFPVCIFYSLSDDTVVPKDAIKTGTDIGNCASLNFINDSDFSHADFTYGINVRALVYDKIIEKIEKSECACKCNNSSG